MPIVRSVLPVLMVLWILAAPSAAGTPAAPPPPPPSGTELPPVPPVPRVFGSAALGLQPAVNYSNLSLKQGVGWTVSVPPLVPAVIALAAVEVYLSCSADSGELVLGIPDWEELWTSGIAYGDSPVETQVAFEAIFSGSSHDAGIYGEADAFRFLVGARATAGTSGAMVLMAGAGWSWHSVHYARAPHRYCYLDGPYLSCGVERIIQWNTFFSISGRWQFLRGYGPDGQTTSSTCSVIETAIRFFW